MDLKRRALKRVVSKHEGVMLNPYQEAWSDSHGHCVSLDGGHSRIETGEIEEWGGIRL